MLHPETFKLIDFVPIKKNIQFDVQAHFHIVIALNCWDLLFEFRRNQTPNKSNKPQQINHYWACT